MFEFLLSAFILDILSKTWRCLCSVNASCLSIAYITFFITACSKTFIVWHNWMVNYNCHTITRGRVRPLWIREMFIIIQQWNPYTTWNIVFTVTSGFLNCPSMLQGISKRTDSTLIPIFGYFPCVFILWLKIKKSDMNWVTRARSLWFFSEDRGMVMIYLPNKFQLHKLINNHLSSNRNRWKHTQTDR